MSIREGAKSLLRETANLAQWLRFNLSSSIEIGRDSKVRGAKIAKNVKIGSHCNIQGGGVSSFSYMGDYCELPQVEIGKFCSIAAHVTLAAGNHPMNYLSTSPYTYSAIRNSFTKKQLMKRLNETPAHRAFLIKLFFLIQKNLLYICCLFRMVKLYHIRSIFKISLFTNVFRTLFKYFFHDALRWPL